MWQTIPSYGTRGESCPSRNRQTYGRLVFITDHHSMILILFIYQSSAQYEENRQFNFLELG